MSTIPHNYTSFDRGFIINDLFSNSIKNGKCKKYSNHIEQSYIEPVPGFGVLFTRSNKSGFVKHITKMRNGKRVVDHVEWRYDMNNERSEGGKYIKRTFPITSASKKQLKITNDNVIAIVRPVPRTNTSPSSPIKEYVFEGTYRLMGRIVENGVVNEWWIRDNTDWEVV